MDAFGWIAGGSVAAGLLATVGATCWQQIRQLGQQLTSRVFAEVEIGGMNCAEAVAFYLSREAWSAPFSTRLYTASLIHVRSRRRDQLVAWEPPPSRNRLFWLKRRYPIWYTPNGESCKLSFLQGTIDPDELVYEAVELINRLVHAPLPDAARYRIEQCYGTAGKLGFDNDSGGRRRYGRSQATAEDSPTETGTSPSKHAINMHPAEFVTRRFVRWSPDELGPTLENESSSALAQLALPEDALRLVDRIRRWKSLGDDFHSRGLPWQIKILLEGEPGTGKTSFVRALAEDENWPVFVLNLATFYDEELDQTWRRAAQHAPCIVLIEDVDHVFHGRENIVEHSPLTHDALLNCLDGVQRTSGVITIMTTNHPDQLDEALTRPGRVDVRLEMTRPDYAGRAKICRRILHGCEEVWEVVIGLGDGETGAEFEKRCGETYLKLCEDRERQATQTLMEDALADARDTRSELAGMLERLGSARELCQPGVG